MKTFDQINVIPFIDIMLVLLTIVLTTASFVSQGLIDINLPEASHTSTPQPHEAKTLEIAINAEQILFLAEKAITKADLDKHLSQLSKQTAIQLRVDEQADFKQFIFVIDKLKQYHLNNLSIFARQSNAQ